MSLDNPLTITDVFRRHDLGTRILAPVLQIQELAIAVSLQGRYVVSADYCGHRHQLVLTEAKVLPVPESTATPAIPVHQLAGRPERHYIPLPREDAPALEAGNQLGAAIQRLTHYLMEGQPS